MILLSRTPLRPGSVVTGLLVAAVLMAALRWGVGAGDPTTAADAAAACPPENPACRVAGAAGGEGGAPPPVPTVAADEVCPGAGYLCAGLEERPDRRLVRWNEDTRMIRIRVPRPTGEPSARARELQEAAARGIRAWQGKPFPLRIDLSDRPGRHDFVVEWSRALGGRELGRARTRWIRVGERADLAVEEFSLSTRSPMDPSRELTPEQVALTAAHEMGHALGLPHSDSPRDVMYPTNTATRLSSRDFTTLQALYDLENGVEIR